MWNKRISSGSLAHIHHSSVNAQTTYEVGVEIACKNQVRVNSLPSKQIRWVGTVGTSKIQVHTENQSFHTSPFTRRLQQRNNVRNSKKS